MPGSQSGALEADVPYFIDQQLAGDYGAGARFYNQGPFGATTLYQGYQLPLTPRQLYRAGIAATNRYCEARYGKRFAQLDAATQDDVLRGLEGIAGDVDLKDVPGATFFTQLLTDTRDGFFADEHESSLQRRHDLSVPRRATAGLDGLAGGPRQAAIR